MSRIAVIGLSNFGHYLARTLERMGSHVLAIDCDASKIDGIKDHVSKAVVADAMEIRALEQLDLASMDWVVLSTGEHLESSILSAFHLKELGVRNIIAKARSEEHARILELMGVKRVVFPERDMGERIAATLHGINIADYLPLGSGLSIVEMVPQKKMIGRSLKELDFRNRYHCYVLAIRTKGPEESTSIADPEMTIEENHFLVVLGKDADLAKLAKG